MTKEAANLSDTQLLILTAASQNPGKSIYPVSKSMKAFGAALNRAISILAGLGFLVKSRCNPGEKAFVEQEGEFYTYRITNPGEKAINADEGSSSEEGQPADQKEDNAMTKEAETETKAADEAKHGRSASNVGKILHSTKEANPRRENTHGHKSHQILLDNPGITYERYIELGGRSVDLAWDIAHEYATATAPETSGASEPEAA